MYLHYQLFFLLCGFVTTNCSCADGFSFIALNIFKFFIFGATNFMQHSLTTIMLLKEFSAPQCLSTSLPLSLFTLNIVLDFLTV